MDWIKKHYDRVALIVAGVILIASAAFLFVQVRAFPEAFAKAQQKYERKSNIEEISLQAEEKAIASITEPAAWKVHPGSLLVSRRYILKDDRLVDPLDNSVEIHPGVPNQWLRDHGLDLLDPNVLNSDPDNDGFTVKEEFEAKTNPVDKNSHPPLVKKLRLKAYMKQPFRLVFSAYDGDFFQINALDGRIPSQFVKIGDTVARTKFEVARFEKKSTYNPRTKSDIDISELILVNKETGEEVRLVLNQTVDSPDSYAQFIFLIDRSEFTVKKDQVFSLPNDPAKTEFKLVDINEREAVITNVATGEKITVPKLD